MKLLPQLILISACCWAASAHAVSCQVAPKGGLGGGVTPALNCGPPPGAGSQFIIPAADIPMCGATPCYALEVQPNVVINLPAKATPAWGSTIAQVQQLFPYNILLNFEDNLNLDAAITATGDTELARLSTELARNDVSGYTYSIMAYAGEKLSAGNLRRLQAAVGPTVFATAVSYMPAATLGQFSATAAYPPIPLGVYWTALNPSLAATVPNDGNLYLYDLLLVDKTASAGETSTVALTHVSQYVQARIKNLAVIAIILTLAFGALQVYDSPGAAALGQYVGDWMWMQTIIGANGTNGGLTNPVIINIPGLGTIIPPAIDVPVPTMPAIEGDVVQNGASSCTNPDNCPTSAT